MEPGILAFALAAGMVAAFNPCGFAMLPAYLALVVLGPGDGSGGQGSGGQGPQGEGSNGSGGGGSGAGGGLGVGGHGSGGHSVGARARSAAVSRALGATAAMAVGFLVVFGAFGLIISPLAGQVQQYLPVVTVLVGVALVGLGLWLVTGRELRLLIPKPAAGAPSGQVRSMFGYGFAYAVASLSCTVGPFLAVTGQTFRAGSVVEGVAAFLAYGAGMAVVVGVLAVAVAVAGAQAVSRIRGALGTIHRVAGALLVVAGAYVVYYGVYELRLFHFGGDAADPLVGAVVGAGEAVARVVDGIGIVPMLAALGLAAVLAVLATRRRSERTGAQRSRQ